MTRAPTAGRVVAITGGSAGVGRATAQEFARRGARVGLIARGMERLEDARREVESLGSQAYIAQADVADPEQVEAAAARIEQELGPIDIWVNNAMTSVFSPVGEMRPEEYARVLEVNYLGYVHGTLSALRRMRPRDEGLILQVGSALAFRGIPLQSAYCASRHAIQGFTESLRSELMHDGSAVRVREVHLPAMNTPQFDWVKSRLPRRAQPVPPIFQPEVAARAIAWMTEHDRPPTLLLGWPTVATLWVNRLFPSITDWYLARNGYESQQTDEPAEPGSAGNLWAPVEGHQGAHGRFDSRSRERSSQLWLATRPGLVLAAAAMVGGVAGVLTRRLSR